MTVRRRGRAAQAPAAGPWPRRRPPVRAQANHAWPQVLRALLEWTGGFAGLGVVVGLLSVGMHAAQRGALPDFGGDEWLSQLVKLGLLCGVLVAVLVAPAAVDGWIYRVAWMAGDVPRVGKPLSRQQFWHAARQGLLVLLSCSLYGLLIAWRPLPAGSRVAVPALLIVMALLSATLHRAARRGVVDAAPPADRFERFERAFHRYGAVVLPQSLIVLAIGVLLPLVEARVDDWTAQRLFGAFVLFGLLAGLLSAVAILSARPTAGALRARLLAVGGLSLAIAALLAPELVRLAGLGNLPRARLLLEPAQACVVERHLGTAAAGDAGCAAGDALRVVEADIVSRLGAHATLAPAGALAAQPAGRCAPAGGPPPAARFPCVDLPRDAVKLLLR